MRASLRALAVLSFSASLGAPAWAQTCVPGNAGLASSVTQAAPGQAVPLDVTGTPGARALVFWADAQGATTLAGPGPLSGTVLCLDGARGPKLLGLLDPAGAASGAVRIPAQVAVGSTLHFQAVTVDGAAAPPVVVTSNLVSVAVTLGPACTAGSVTLDVQPDVPVTPGTPITVDVTGAPGARALLARSLTLGTTPLGHLGVDLCLGGPFQMARLGRLDPSGALQHVFPNTAGAGLPAGTTVHFQVLTLDRSTGGVVADTSNLDALVW